MIKLNHFEHASYDGFCKPFPRPSVSPGLGGRVRLALA